MHPCFGQEFKFFYGIALPEAMPCKVSTGRGKIFCFSYFPDKYFNHSPPRGFASTPRNQNITQIS